MTTTTRRVRRDKVDAAINEMGLTSAVDEPAPEGTEVTVVWGEEVFSPVQYNSFRVGGTSIKTTTKPGETVRQAHQRVWKMLEELAETQFADKVNGFGERINRSKGRG